MVIIRRTRKDFVGYVKDVMWKSNFYSKYKMLMGDI